MGEGGGERGYWGERRKISTLSIFENYLGATVLVFVFSSPTPHSKLQNVNIILFGAFLGATVAFSDTSIVYYSSKRYMCNQHF